MSQRVSDDATARSLVPWLLGRLEPYSLRQPAPPHLVRQAEGRLREYIRAVGAGDPSPETGTERGRTANPGDQSGSTSSASATTGPKSSV